MRTRTQFQFGRFARSRAGNFAVMTALTAPFFCIAVGGIFETGMALSYVAQSKRVMALACERTTKPTRTLTPSDAARRTNALMTFDALAKSAKQTVSARDATIDWLNTTMTATFSYPTTFVKALNLATVNYTLTHKCQGIPPYPYDTEVLLSSALTKTDGSTLKLQYGQSTLSPNGCWGVFKATEFGWDSGTGAGPEIQDWTNAYCRTSQFWVGLPPNDFPTPYAIELDSWNNSTMTKLIELHPGKYEISVWYSGRNPLYEGSNMIYIDLQRTRPTVGPQQRVIEMSQDKNNIAWKKYAYNVTVSEYALYNLTIGAGGASDTYGGVITSFQVKFLDR